MSRTINTEPLQKVTLNIYKGDYDRMAILFAPRNFTAAQAIRELIREYLTSADEMARQGRPEVEVKVSL